MIYDSDEYDDACKGNVDNKGKEFSKKDLHALLDNPDFSLLHVPENGNKMRIVRPASDSYHRKRIIDRINEAKHIPLAYYTLSHIWGVTENNRQLWTEIGEYVDDENGLPVDPVSMRPEKRNTLLGIFQSHPESYWWIDSIALIDCEPRIIPQLNSMRNQLNSLLSSVTRCSWWNRVWTFQEMALPPTVILVPETITEIEHPDNMIDIDDIRDFEVILGKMLLYLIKIGSRPLQAPSTAFKELRFSRGLEMDRKSSFLDLSSLVNLFNLLGQSSRQCMDPVDYVYGVLGLLRIRIPRMTYPKAVWQLFLYELEPVLNELLLNQFTTSKGGVVQLVGINEDAYQIDLLDARNMADVYRNFLIVYNCVV
ncbi:hypothetical protein K492DRAFT_196881 [Lichtheimia hyalospora FSU 10163]|nr:hypothetical protein K492DRAFT_196881 [Lichtheimia hyalospora FSU 10163]